jgi:cysteine desulfurase
VTPTPSGPPPGFFDAASGLPLSPVGREALLASLDSGWADPARLYREARRAGQLLEASRASIASVLGCAPDEVSFDSTLESAVRRGLGGLLQGRARASNLLVVSTVEHSAVLHQAQGHEDHGGRVERIGVTSAGVVHADEMIHHGLGAAAVALQAANHEVGTTQPVQEVAAALGEVPLFVDAHQVVGRAPVPPGWSVLTASARHWGGPGGVGVLAVRHPRWRSPDTPHDGREHGRVPGQPNIPGIVAAAAALEDVQRYREAEDKRLRALVDRIRTQVPALIPDVEVLGHPTQRLAHIVTFSCLYVEGEALLGALDREGFAVSSGSACTSDVLTPSHVLVAMGALSHGNIRVSLPHGVREQDVERFLEVLPRVVDAIRTDAGTRGL